MSSAMPRPEGRRDLTEGSLLRNLFILAAPLMVQMSIQAIYNLTDAFWLGKLSSLAVTAPNKPNLEVGSVALTCSLKKS